MATHFTRVLRAHLPFVVIAPLLIIGMTWPTLVYAFDTDELWLPRRDIDINMLFWDAWYFKRLVAGQADFYFTDLKFHPEGVSLAYHNFSLPHMALFAGLQAFLPPFNAFNLTYLVLVYLTILSGYIYLHYLFRDRWIALFGAVVFGAGGFVLMRPGQMMSFFIATIPLSMYFYQRGILEKGRLYMLVAGGLVGATAFIGLYMLVCLLIILAAFTAYYARRRWRDGGFWRRLFLFCLLAAALTLVRVIPMVTDSAGLADALNKVGDREYGNDLLAYFTNYPNPITGPIFETVFGPDPGLYEVYLGYIPMLLVILAIARRHRRAEKSLWLILLAFFLVMRLGSTLTIRDVKYEDILLPKHYLTEWLPQVFKPFWATFHFHAGVLLPFAALACYGLLAVLQSVPSRQRRRGIIIIVLALVAIEYYQGPDPKIIPKQQFDFIDWLKTEPDQDSIHLINLPMGGQNSKYYDFHQTMTGYPQVEGRPTRRPSAAFNYIESNALLSAWRAGKSIHCLPSNRDAFEAAAAQLLADEFSHIILHKWRDPYIETRNRIMGLPPAYDDNFVTIYRVEDMELGCDHSALLNLEPHLNLARLAGGNVVIPKSGAAALSIHPRDGLSGSLRQYYMAAEAAPEHLAPLNIEDLRNLRAASQELQRFELQTALSGNGIALLVYDPRGTDQDLLKAYSGWLGERFKQCDPFPANENMTVATFLDDGYPCDLVLDDQPFAVHYDGGIQVGNILYDIRERSLELDILWGALPQRSHAISLQFSDADGSKAYGQDFVIGLDSLKRYRADLSSLAPGDYVVKMILYDYETRKSAPGTVIGSDSRFDRELELARLIVE